MHVFVCCAYNSRCGVWSLLSRKGRGVLCSICNSHLHKRSVRREVPTLLIYYMKAHVKEKQVDLYNGFLVHIKASPVKRCWHRALVEYAAKQYSRSFVEQEVAVETNTCFRLAVTKAKPAGTIHLWVYRALATELKVYDLKPREAYEVECVQPVMKQAFYEAHSVLDGNSEELPFGRRQESKYPTLKILGSQTTSSTGSVTYNSCLSSGGFTDVFIGRIGSGAPCALKLHHSFDFTDALSLIRVCEITRGHCNLNHMIDAFKDSDNGLHANS